MSQTVTLGSRPVADERIARRSWVSQLFSRPEIGSLIGAIVIYIFFFVVAEPFRQATSLATMLYASSTIGMMAVGVALLMIGGEFDLSAGVAVTSASLTAAMVSYELGLNLWVGVFISLIVALGVGALNGYLVVRTGIPSFLVTLGTFLILQGINLAVTKIVTGNVATPSIANMEGFGSARAIFASEWNVGGALLRVTVLWWIVFVVAATWVLLRTKIDNWIFAARGA